METHICLIVLFLTMILFHWNITVPLLVHNLELLDFFFHFGINLFRFHLSPQAENCHMELMPRHRNVFLTSEVIPIYLLLYFMGVSPPIKALPSNGSISRGIFKLVCVIAQPLISTSLLFLFCFHFHFVLKK